jgi:hypothetical protein
VSGLGLRLLALLLISVLLLLLDLDFTIDPLVVGVFDEVDFRCGAVDG